MWADDKCSVWCCTLNKCVDMWADDKCSVWCCTLNKCVDMWAAVSYGSWNYNYLYNQCLSPLTLWEGIPPMRSVLDTTLCVNVCQWLATGSWFSPGTPISSTNKTDPHEYNWHIVESDVEHHKPTYTVHYLKNILICLDLKRIVLRFHWSDILIEKITKQNNKNKYKPSLT
jgi:hypothetical protein